MQILERVENSYLLVLRFLIVLLATFALLGAVLIGVHGVFDATAKAQPVSAHGFVAGFLARSTLVGSVKPAATNDQGTSPSGADQRDIGKIYTDLNGIAHPLGFLIREKHLRNAITSNPAFSAHPRAYAHNLSTYVAKVTSDPRIRKGVTALNFTTFLGGLFHYYNRQHALTQAHALKDRSQSFTAFGVAAGALAVFLTLTLILVLARIERDLDKIHVRMWPSDRSGTS